MAIEIRPLREEERETIYALPFKLSRTPGAVRRAAPLLGQDNAYIYMEVLGLSPEEVERLTESGAIA